MRQTRRRQTGGENNAKKSNKPRELTNEDIMKLWDRFETELVTNGIFKQNLKIIIKALSQKVDMISKYIETTHNNQTKINREMEYTVQAMQRIYEDKHASLIGGRRKTRKQPKAVRSKI